MNLLRQKSPMELFSAARVGGEAETVKRVLGGTLGQEVESIVLQIAASKPDVGSYSHLAGQLKMVLKILKSLDMQVEEARDAGMKLREGM